MQKVFKYLIWLFLVLVALALSFKSLSEPDLWWQLLTGDWILTNFEIPRTDIFSFTYFGVEWINVKWLFEVLQAVFNSLGGPELLYLMQSLVNLGLLYLFWKIFKLNKSQSQEASILFFVIMIVAVFTALNFRMNGRPEMISHLFTALFLFLFLHNQSNKGKLIYLLIPLQALWANLHEAFGLGMVLLLIFAFSQLASSFILKSKDFDKHALIAPLLAVLAVSINPRGFYMLIHPLEIFGQVGANKFTTELFSFQTDYYWEQFEPYIALGILIISLMSLPSILKKGFLKALQQPFGLGYWFIFAATAYLASTAHRNIPFFVIWVSPALLNSLLKLNSFVKATKVKFIAAFSLVFVFYLLIINNKLYSWTKSDYKYGLAVSNLNNPIGAAKFIKDSNLKGPCFSDYLVSSYLLWELRPEFKSFIDFRDLDIFPATFFEDFNQLAIYPQNFDTYHNQYNFGYAALNLLEFPALHLYLLNKESWELAYADHVSVVFVNTEINPLSVEIAGLEERKGVFENYTKSDLSSTASLLNFAVNPLYSGNQEEIDLAFASCLYFQSLGRYNVAVKRAEKALLEEPNNLKLQAMLGNSFLLWAGVQDNEQSKRKLLALAFEAYNEGLQVDRNNPEILLGIAQVQMNIGKAFDAMGTLNRLVEIKEDAEAYALMAQCQNILMQTDSKQSSFYTLKWYEYMLKAQKLNPKDPILNYNLGVSYCQSGDCLTAKEFLENAIYSPDLSQKEMQTLAACKKQCGVADD